jgi:type VI secretion system secreted protein VgrG
VRANDHLTVADKQHLKIGTGQFVEAGNEIHYYAGNKVVLDAGMELTAKGGGSFLKLDPGGVTLSGATIKINSGGGPGKGSGIAVVLPVIPGAADKDQAGNLLAPAPRSHKARYLLLDEKTSEPLVGTPYTLKLADGSRLAGYSDHEGKTLLMHSAEPAKVELLTPLRQPEPQQPLFMLGATAPKDMTLDYKNANPESV